MPKSNNHVREVYFDLTQGWRNSDEFQRAIKVGENREFSEQMKLDPSLSEIDKKELAGNGFEIDGVSYVLHAQFRGQLKEAFLNYADLGRYNIRRDQDGELIDENGRSASEKGFNGASVDLLVTFNALVWLKSIIESSHKE